MRHKQLPKEQRSWFFLRSWQICFTLRRFGVAPLRLNLLPDARKLRSYLISKIENHVLTPFLEGEGVATKVRPSLNPCINGCGYSVAVFLPILPKNCLSILADESTRIKGQRHEPILPSPIIVVA